MLQRVTTVALLERFTRRTREGGTEREGEGEGEREKERERGKKREKEGESS